MKHTSWLGTPSYSTHILPEMIYKNMCSITIYVYSIPIYHNINFANQIASYIGESIGTNA